MDNGFGSGATKFGGARTGGGATMAMDGMSKVSVTTNILGEGVLFLF